MRLGRTRSLCCTLEGMIYRLLDWLRLALFSLGVVLFWVAFYAGVQGGMTLFVWWAASGACIGIGIAAAWARDKLESG